MFNYKKSVLKIQHHGREIFGVLYMPETENKCPVVIFSHGYNGSSSDFTMNSEYLASNGIAAYCYDFCGGSVNSKSEMKTTEMTLFTEKEDLHAVIDKLKTHENIDEKNIFLFGASQGGLVTALTAEDRIMDINGILLLFPAFCIAEDWNKRFPEYDDIPDTQELWGMTLGRIFFETIHGYDVFKHIGKFDKNVQIFLGDKDSIVKLGYGERALAAYQNAKLDIFNGEGHGFSEAGNKKVAEMTYEFVKQNINK